MSTAAALMPPHITRTVPESGGVLAEPLVEIHGYTLGLAGPDDLKVVDLNTGQTVAVDPDMDCQWEGEGDCPGCKQERCVLRVRLLRACSGHEYEIEYLEQKLRFTYGGEPVNCE